MTDGAARSPGLTIGQLAAFAGVTVRTVRHYHQRGLLDEPERDHSGYRRYDAQAALDLVRIRVLAEAGAPLSRAAELAEAGPEELAAAVEQIDAGLERQIRNLRDRRRRLAALVDGERGVLPAELVALLDDLRAAGVGPGTIRIEQEGWVLMLARYPAEARRWLAGKRRDLADPVLRRLYRAYDEAAGWDPEDPRLAGLADDLITHLRRARTDDLTAETLDPMLRRVVEERFEQQATPTARRLAHLVARTLGG